MLGIFDSGSGGLSVLSEIRKRLPVVDVLYFGDIKNAPYGKKTQEELSALTVQSIQFLQEHGADTIVSACNSVSASLAISLFDVFNLSSDKLVEMVGPTVNYFREEKQTERVLLCATPATVLSGIYQNAFRMVGKDIMTVAIPDLAGAIEFHASEEELEQLIQKAFAKIASNSFDTLILGCTHYPLIAPLFARVLGTAVLLFDPASVVAQRVEKQISHQEIGTGKLTFVITRDSVTFRNRVSKMFLQSNVAVEMLK